MVSIAAPGGTQIDTPKDVGTQLDVRDSTGLALRESDQGAGSGIAEQGVLERTQASDPDIETSRATELRLSDHLRGGPEASSSSEVASSELAVFGWQLATIEQVEDSYDGPDPVGWVDDHLEELIEQYRGRWIAVTGEGVAAYSDDLKDLLRQIDENNLETPFVTEIPRDPIPWATAYDNAHL